MLNTQPIKFSSRISGFDGEVGARLKEDSAKQFHISGSHLAGILVAIGIVEG